MKKFRAVFRRPLVWAAIAGIYVVPLLTLQGAGNMFLKLNGIAGESVDSKHSGEIEILSWNWGGSAPAAFSGGSPVPGKATNTDLTITKNVDKTTPTLLLRMATGAPITDATLSVRKSPTLPDYIKIVLTNVLVTSISTGGNDSASEVVESVSFFFGKVAFTYTPVDGNGKAGTPITTTWDVAANKANPN